MMGQMLDRALGFLPCPQVAHENHFAFAATILDRPAHEFHGNGAPIGVEKIDLAGTIPAPVSLEPLFAEDEDLRRAAPGQIGKRPTGEATEALVGFDDDAIENDRHAFERGVGEPSEIGQLPIDEEGAEGEYDQCRGGCDDPAGKPGGMNGAGDSHIGLRHERHAAHRREVHGADCQHQQQGGDDQPPHAAQGMKSMKRGTRQQRSHDERRNSRLRIVAYVPVDLDRLHAGEMHRRDAGAKHEATAGHRET
ncbi:hypothetical protein D9M70_431660 [compost metagenome]